METKQRLEYIDSAKAIAIILVIVGHCHWVGAIPKLGNLIYTFHMPLFFIVSGFFLKQLSIKDALKKYSKAYLWPYLVIGFLIVLIGILKCLWDQEPWYSLIPLNLIKIIWGSNCESDIFLGTIPHIGPSWFLLALFWGCVFYTVLNKIRIRLQRVVFLWVGVSFALCSAKVMKLPLSLQGGVICVIFLYIGSLTNRYNVLDKLSAMPLYLKMLSILLWFMVAAFAPGLDIGSGSLGFSIVGFTVSLIGTFFVIGACKTLHLRFNWVGKNTLNILCAHILIWRIFDIFDFASKDLPFLPAINFMVETTYEITLALLLAWLFSKIHILEFNKIFK